MPTLNIGGRSVTVGDEFLKMSPDQQNSTVEEIAKSLMSMVPKAAPDKYQQAAIDERADLKAKGIEPGDAGYTRRLTHGATLGADSTILAAAMTPGEMIKRGTLDPREGYNYAKAREDLIMNKSRENTGLTGAVVEGVGGAVSAAGLAAKGITAARYLPEGANLAARAGASSADAAGVGLFSGAMEGNGLQERGTNALKGAAVGGSVGYLAPGVAALVKILATPVTSQIAARMNPKAYAEAQVARAISESKLTPDEVSLAMVQAANEGQGVFTLADALGNPGQRMLSTVTRSPGQARTDVVEALNSRQGDQGRRLSGALREGFDAPQTADQTRQGMSATANREASFNYAPVKADPTAIDVSNPVAIANRAISPAADRLAAAPTYEIVPPAIPADPLSKARAALAPEAPTYREVPGAPPTDLAARSAIERSESVLRDPIASALKEARSYLAAPTLTASNVGQAFRAKTNIDQMIAKATENKQGALVAELIPVRDALDDALARTSRSYASARDAYKLAQQRIEALDLGKTLGSKPVRPEDAIRQFEPLDAEAKQAFRAGYVDPQISQVQNAAFGANKARPFTSDAVKQEFDAFAAPGRAEQLQRQIGRENTMFETRNHAMGGSRTTDNLNDDAAMAVSPEVLGVLKNVVMGNMGAAVQTAIAAGKNGLTGNTAAVRQHVADLLLQTGRNIPASMMQDMVDNVLQRALRVAKIAESAGRGLVGGAVESGPSSAQRR